MANNSIDELNSLMNDINALNATPRSGWLRVGVPHPESVGNHTLGVAIIALWLVDFADLSQVIDTGILLQSALLHDLAEARMSDIPGPVKGLIGKNEVAKAEKSLLRDICNDAGRHILPPQLDSHNFESTLEYQLLKCADQIDMFLNAWRYAKLYHVDIAEFLRSYHPADNERLSQVDAFVHKLLHTISDDLDLDKED